MPLPFQQVSHLVLESLLEVRSLWDAHDTNENGYLDQTELESLLIHLHKAIFTGKKASSTRP